MNIRISLIGAGIAAALACASANAQVLGGGIGGAVGGTLSGGMGHMGHDMDMITRGSAAGSLGADLDAGSLHRTTRGTLDRTTSRVRNTAAGARNRAESTVGRVRDTSANAAASAAATATQTVNAQQIDAASSIAGSAAAEATSGGTQLAGAAEGAADQGALIKPDLANPIGEDAVTAPKAPAGGEPSAAPGGAGRLANLTDSGLADSPRESRSESEERSAPRGLTAGTALDGSASGGTLLGQDDAPLNASGDANGSASGNASASRKAVSAQSSASAEGSGSASVSTQR